MASSKKGNAPASPRKDVSPDEAPAKLLRKITPKTVMEDGSNAKLAKFAPKEGEPEKACFDVFGIATGLVSGDTQYGDWTGMTGMFEAVRYDGRRYEAGTCILPGAAGEILIGSMKAAGVIPARKTKEGKTQAAPAESATVNVEFAVRVGIQHIVKRDGTDGYEFTTQEIVKVARADALADLRAKALSFDG